MTEHPSWVAIVLAAGQGTRMNSRLPKVAHEIAGRPIVRHVIDCARAAGVGDIVVVVGPDASEVRAAAGQGVRFAVQDAPLGTGHAVDCARAAAGNATHALIMNGDVPLVLPETLRRLMDTVAVGAADLAVLTAEVRTEEYGVLELDAASRVRSIVETKHREDVDRSGARCINSGQYAARTAWLWPHLSLIAPAPNGERYFTQLAEMAATEGVPALAVFAQEPDEVRGINDRVQLAESEAVLRARIRRRHMLGGVTIVDPSSTFIDAAVRIGRDTTIEPGTHLRGETSVGEGSVIGPSAFVRDSSLGHRVVVRQATLEGATVADDVDIGPYCHVRPGSEIGAGAHLGNYAEVKASRLGRRTKMGHFSYIGDADVGDDVNIGAGTITANYDGTDKHRTVIGDGAFIGSDTMLVAPVRIGAGARTSAGSVVTRDVPDGAMAIGAPARIRSIEAAGEEPGAGSR